MLMIPRSLPNATKTNLGRRGAKKPRTAAGDGSEQIEAAITYKSLVRHGLLFVLLLAAGVATFLYRDEVMAYVGYGALPIGVWSVLFVYLVITRTGWMIGRYREIFSSAFLVAGGATVLGIFDAPLGAASGATMGGTLGEILAREPYEWHRYDLILWQQVLAWGRAGALFTVGAAIQFPSAAASVGKVLWIGTLVVISASISLMMSAGGAAVAATRRRKQDDVTQPIETPIENIAPSAVAAEEQYNAFQPLTSDRYASDPKDYDLGNEMVIGMGDTIFVEEEEETDELNAEVGIADDVAEIATVESVPSTVAPEPIVEDLSDEVEDEALPEELAEVDELIDEVFHEIEVADDSSQSAMAVEQEDSMTSTIATSSETEQMLEMITSGAAVEAAVNAFPWHLPPVEFLAKPPQGGVASTEIRATSDLIEETLAEHGIAVTVDQVSVGPTVTMYGLKPGWKGTSARSNAPRQRVRVDTILNREKDIALALSSPNIRFESVVAGSSVVGIEVPNASPTPVNLRTVMDSDEWAEFVDDAALPVPLGIGSGGNPVMSDFSKMPHTLVAGATGSGKSVCMNTIVTGLLLTRTPSELRMVMIDPKRVELTPYQGIPHLYTPVIVEPELAVKALKALVKEMMERFSTLEAAGVKNISTYNEKSTAKMPYLLILVDELADLMLTASNDVEQLLVRLAQLGRATGVHLVVATQRPSVDVVTGLIKANFPSRISFAVGSQVDSRTILDATGADRLLGKGDMLYKPIDLSQPVRVQGAFLAEEEIETVVDFWKEVGAPPLPQLDIDGDSEDDDIVVPGMTEESGDALFMQASTMAKSQKTLSTSLLQRRLRIGYPRAARLMDELEDAGIVGPGEPGKPRQVIANS